MESCGLSGGSLLIVVEEEEEEEEDDGHREARRDTFLAQCGRHTRKSEVNVVAAVEGTT
jgi:hypothetical protein